MKGENKILKSINLIKKLDKKIALIIGILVIALVVGYGLQKDKEVKEVTSAVEQLIYAITSNEIISPANYSVGDVLFKLHNHKGTTSAEIENLKFFLNNYNKNYAEISCQIDLKLTDSSYDVSWYDLKLINKDGWKVYKVEMAEPIHTSYLFKINKKSDMFEHIFKEYVKTQDIKQYTAGALRQNLERTESEKLTGITDLKMVYLYGDDKLVKFDANYKMGDRQVDNIITFYKTKEGWKMVDIRSSFIK